MYKYLFLILFIFGNIFVQDIIAQDIIDISVKGISDSNKEGAQKDRQEAIMDAKRQACEKAGVQLKSTTTVENFQTIFDYIESKSEAVLLPGFQIIDIGYVADGTYQVVLSGKIKVVKEEKISTKEIRYAKSLFDRQKFNECQKILEKYINSKDVEVDEKLKEESLYYYIKWGFSFNAEEDCEKYVAFYPESERKEKIIKYSIFSKTPLLSFDKTFETDNSHWTDKIYKYKSNEYQKWINAYIDTLYFNDFYGKKNSIIVQFSLHSSSDSDNKQPAAYMLKILYSNDDISTQNQIADNIIIIEERFKGFNMNSSKTFQHSSSGKLFGKFRLKYLQIKGDVPADQEKYKYNIKFNIYPKGF